MTLQEAILQKMEESFLIAEKHFNRKFDRPREVIWNDKTTTAGYCSWSEKTLMFNPRLAMENEDDFLATTVPHEVAHWIDAAVFGIKWKRTRRGKIRWILHGPNWKHIMVAVFKIPADRCHDYDVTNSRGRVVLRPYKYVCPCGTTFDLTESLHNKVMKGQSRRCNKCKGRIKWIDSKTPEQLQLEKLTRQLELLKKKQGA